MLPLKIKVRVVKGKGRGKTLGFPTLNFTFPENLNIPHGVYAGKILFNDKSYPGAIHFGPRPVFGEKDNSLEAFILDSFSDTIVDAQLELVKFIRDIKNFPDQNKLIDQIKQDVRVIKEILQKVDNQNIQSIVNNTYPNYIAILKKLVSINTVYSQPKSIIKALNFCKKELKNYLPNYKIYFDDQNNLLCFHPGFDSSQDILYLSSHIDTVGADKSQWHKKFDPFIPYEDEQTIVGRGVNDDKAGVAYELFLSLLISKYFPKTSNIVFTITNREEQAGISAQEIGDQIGKKLPKGSKNYLITLENNVRITSPPTLCINYGENGAFAIEITDSLKAIKSFLRKDPNPWNPTSISPMDDTKSVNYINLHQAGGHAATTARGKNLLYTLLFTKDIDSLILNAGDPKAISNVPDIIQYSKSDKTIKHKLICDLRSMKSLNQITKELNKHSLNYHFIKSLDHGYDIKSKLFGDEIYKMMLKLKNDNLNLAFEINPGSTDTGTILAKIDKNIKNKFIPLTMGPGSRSQRENDPPRLTHGVNETYMKTPGLESIKFITEILSQMKFLRIN